MKEIECILFDNQNSLIEGYIKKLINDVDRSAKFIDLKSSAINSPLIVLVNSESLSELKNLFDSRNQKIIIALNTRKDFKLISELKPHFEKIFGFIDLTQEVEYNTPLLNNYLNLIFPQSASGLQELASNLEKVYEFTKSELVKIKDLHDRFVKVREDKFKGASVISKFMVGEKSGGEFFDVIQNENEVLFIEAGSNSYLLTSMIIAEIESLKENSKKQDIHLQMELFQKAINHHASETHADLTYCLMLLDLKTLHANFIVKGIGHLFYKDELMSFDKPLKLKLKPKDKLFVISEGAVKNWNELSKISMKGFFSDHKDHSVKDLVSDFFFEISRNKKGPFLNHDALLAITEIEESVIYQLS